MPPKKIDWGDVPNEEHIKNKDTKECYLISRVWYVQTYKTQRMLF